MNIRLLSDSGVEPYFMCLTCDPRSTVMLQAIRNVSSEYVLHRSIHQAVLVALVSFVSVALVSVFSVPLGLLVFFRFVLDLDLLDFLADPSSVLEVLATMVVSPPGPISVPDFVVVVAVSVPPSVVLTVSVVPVVAGSGSGLDRLDLRLLLELLFPPDWTSASDSVAEASVPDFDALDAASRFCLSRLALSFAFAFAFAFALASAASSSVPAAEGASVVAASAVFDFAVSVAVAVSVDGIAVDSAGVVVCDASGVVVCASVRRAVLSAGVVVMS